MRLWVLWLAAAAWGSPCQRVDGRSAVVVSSVGDLRRAAADAKLGATILIAPGEYVGGVFLKGLHGAAGRPIVIAGQSRDNPPRFVGGSGFQISGASHLVVRDLQIVDTRANGLNIDDAGNPATPSRQITIERVAVRGTPKGNYDGIKLSGVQQFRVVACRVERWGGSAVDMVGCHDGVIETCTFRDGGDSAVQAKGGSSQITVRACRFVEYGARGVNIGGNTGLEFFRPPVKTMPPNGRYEARAIRVEGNTFVGGGAPIAFVGVDGATVRFNTIYTPDRWAIRILQETRAEGFVPCRNGAFEDNLVVFRIDRWASGGVNIGDGTAAHTFRFARNFWYCIDDPARSTPRLPTPEVGGVYGVDPRITVDESGAVTVAPTSPARGVGAHAYRRTAR